MTGPPQKILIKHRTSECMTGCIGPGLPLVFVVVSLLEKENFHVDGAEAEVGWI